MSTIDLIFDLHSLKDIIIKTKSVGFLLNYKSKNYIISVNHGLPVDKVFIDTCDLSESYKRDIIINSFWNELIIINSNIEEYSIEKIKNIKLKLPSINDIIKLKYNDIVLEVLVDTFEFGNLNNLPINPRCIYIKAKLTEEKNIFSLVGSPVFDENNKLIGIFSKQYSNNYILILPAYYLTKTLTKVDNYSIYGLNFNDTMKKLNSNNIFDNLIFHNKMNIRVPLDVYTMLEGDVNKEVTINKRYKQKYESINNMIPINNERKLINNKNKFLLNSSLLLMIKLIDPSIAMNYIQIIKNNLGKEIYLTINDNLESRPHDSNLSVKLSENIINFNNINYNFRLISYETF